MSNLLISVAAEFTGKKAFKQAETSSEKLSKTVKSLAKSLGLTFGAAKVFAFAKASVQAAAKDEKAQQQLALALKNVGLSRDAANAESYIQRLQSEFGVLDDKLRPAYQKLAIATKDTAETQKLLNLSLDISAATGKDLDSVTSALSKAYLGSNTALSKLGVGISKADLKTKSFADVTDKLAVTFAGSAKSAANTFQGSIDKLGVASQNVKEIIGVGIIDAFKILSTDSTVDDLATSMETLATNTADVIRGLSSIASELQNIKTTMPSWLVSLFNISNKLTPIGQGLNILKGVSEIGAKDKRITDYAKQKNPVQSGSYLNKPTAAATVQTKIAKQNLAVNTAQLKLAKAKAIFDMQKIQIEAALKGKISDEDRIRLKLMQAIESENVDMIDKYTKALDDAQKKTKELQILLNGLKGVDPFANWSTLDFTAQMTALDNYLASFKGNMATAFNTLGEAQKALLGGYVPFVGSTAAAATAALIPTLTPSGTGTSSGSSGTGTGGTNVQITVNGAVDPISTANQIKSIFDSAGNQVGSIGGLGSGFKAVTYVV